MFFDHHGLIVTKNGNGGDTAARMGLWMVSNYFLWKLRKINHREYNQKTNEFRLLTNKLEIAPGCLIRHPDRSKDWDSPGVRDFSRWNDWRVFSRDQFLPLVVGFYISEKINNYNEALYGLKKRHGIHQNGDFTGPSHWGIFNRLGFDGLFSKYPLLCDFHLFIDTVLQRFTKDASNAINGFIMLLIANEFKPTFWSKLSLKFAKKFDNYQSYFDEYFGNPNDPGSEFHIYCKPILEEYFEQ